jgi:peroxiredoxin Q/BCP
VEITVKEGDAFPTLKGDTQSGDVFDLASVGAMRKVVYFYPKDNTPGCTIEANTFNGSLAQFEARNAVVIGVSADDGDSHKSFCDAYDLKLTLVSDKDGAVATELGIYEPMPGFEKFGPFPARVTFLLDEGNIVRRIWVVKDIPGHPAEVLSAIDEL